MLRRWVCFALAKLWGNLEDAKQGAITDGVLEALVGLLGDEVRLRPNLGRAQDCNPNC